MKWNLCWFLLWFALPAFNQNLQLTYQEAVEAYKAKDYLLFLHKMQSVDSIRPNHPTVLYNLATALVLNQNTEEAIETLRRSLWLNASPDFEKDEDWQALKHYPPFQDFVKEINQLRATSGDGQVIMTLADSTFHPEGIAYHEARGDYYFGSVRHKKIIRRDQEGHYHPVLIDDPINAVMGMQIDQKRHLLWICTSPIPEMEGYTDKQGQKSAVLCYDLVTKKVKTRYEVNDTTAWLGDLAIAPNGDVFVSDSHHPFVYKIDLQNNQLNTWIELPSLRSLQGLTFTSKGKFLYLADYINGIYRIKLVDKSIQKVQNHSKHPLKGIDGLYFNQNNLIAIQNGVYPNRVVKYHLSKSGSQIEDFSFLDKALEEYGEPTLGVIVNKHLYYIANSPWGAYDKSHNQIAEQLQKPIVIKVKL